jgi:hypothetical protein
MRTLGDHPTSLYADGSTLLAWQDTVTGVQRFFMGHTASVVAVAFSGDGQLMATAQVRSECALSTHHSIQRCNALRIVTSGLARAKNDGQIPNTRGERVHVSTGYYPGEGNRRASRNSLVSDLPPEVPNVTIRNCCIGCLRVRYAGYA